METNRKESRTNIWKELELTHQNTLARVKELKGETKISTEQLFNAWHKTVDLTSKSLGEHIVDFLGLLRSKAETLSAEQKKISNDLAGRLTDVLMTSHYKAESSVTDYYETFTGQLKEAINQFIALTVNYQESMKQSGDVFESVSKTIFQEPPELISKYHTKIQKEMKKFNSLNRADLQKSILELKSTFANKITDDIDKIHGGVLKTKDLVNDTIIDSVNHIKQNLTKLNEELDQNFGDEIGKLQNTMHDYETGMLNAFETAVGNYETQVAEIVETQNKQVKANMHKLAKEIDKMKAVAKEKVETMQANSNTALNSTLDKVTEDFDQTAKFVLDSHTQLKGALSENKANHIKSLNETFANFSENVQVQVEEFVSLLKTTEQDELRNLNKSSLEVIGEINKGVKGNITEVERDLKDVENSIVELLRNTITQKRKEYEK